MNIELGSFEAAFYEGDSITLKKTGEFSYETINENQWHILKYLKQTKDLLSVLIPAHGVATKKQTKETLDLFRKLHSLKLLKFSQTSEPTGELLTQKLHFESLHSLGASVIGVFTKILGVFSPAQLFVLAMLLAGLGIVFFPFELVFSAVQAENFSYRKFFSILYLAGCASFSTRAIFQAAYLRASKRSSSIQGLTFYGPFLSLFVENSDVVMCGRNARMQLALLGILAPLSLTAIAVGLYTVGFISLAVAFLATSCFFIISLFLLCPGMNGDGAEIFHCVLRPESIEKNTAYSFRQFLKGQNEYHKHYGIIAVATVVWVFLWTNALRSFGETFMVSYVGDFYFSGELAQKMQANIFFATVYLLVLLPLVFFTSPLFSRMVRAVFSKKKIVSVPPLDFDAQMKVLERIPLFMNLEEKNRVALFNEMRSEFFADGDALVEQGAEGDEFFVIIRGKAKAIYRDTNGASHEVGTLLEGDAFGEVALIDNVPRTASIIAHGGCQVLILKKENFEKFLTSVASADSVKQMIRLSSFFHRHVLFSRLPGKDLANIIASIRFEFVTRDEPVNLENSNMYVVYSGKLKVDTGDDATDLFLQEEDFFGYAGEENVLRVTAVDGAGVLQLKKDDFFQHVCQRFTEHPELLL